jgi:hypothetical protein
MRRRPNLSTGPASLDKARCKAEGRAAFCCRLVEALGVSLISAVATGLWALTMAAAASGSYKSQ